MNYRTLSNKARHTRHDATVLRQLLESPTSRDEFAVTCVHSHGPKLLSRTVIIYVLPRGGISNMFDIEDKLLGINRLRQVVS